ncbi:hypothetical protein NKH72_21880 [Mesorhizobium sp. M0955]|uniref:hypothetical protein n=1 Tax=Mesorhizobium sp. M0955 TaxID=2957033 RepID=UPI0033350374
MPTDIESVESLLEGLELDDNETVELEAVEEVIGDDIAEEEVQDLELSLEREEAYNDQEGGVSADMNTEAPAQAQAAQAAKKPARAPKAAGVARTPRDLATVDAAFFVLEGDAATMDAAALDANKAAVMSTVPSQKKIAEKFENLFSALSVGKQPSVYVVQAFKLLDAKKTLTSTDIVASFKGSYKQGTAMSQAGQIMNLFDVVKIAKRTKNTLVLNEDSVVAERIRTAITKP